jgi:hypothetical protein
MNSCAPRCVINFLTLKFGQTDTPRRARARVVRDPPLHDAQVVTMPSSTFYRNCTFIDRSRLAHEVGARATRVGRREPS